MVCKQALFDFTAVAVHLLGSVIQGCRFLPSQFNASKPCDQRIILKHIFLRVHRYWQLGSAPSSTSDRLRRWPNPPPAGRFEGLEWRGEYGRRAHLTHLSPALNRTPGKNEEVRETPRRTVPGTTVPGQAAGGSGQFEMTQDAADDRLVSDGRDGPQGALLTPRAPLSSPIIQIS